MADEPVDVDTMVEPVVPGRHRWLAGLLDARPGDRVADLGCGTGSTLAQVAAGLVVGVDVSSAVLARAAWALAPIHGTRSVLAQALQGAGWAEQTMLEGWLDGLRRLDERGAFLFSLNDYAVVCGRMRG
jgi:SAM-dependent methyltransferase